MPRDGVCISGGNGNPLRAWIEFDSCLAHVVFRGESLALCPRCVMVVLAFGAGTGQQAPAGDPTARKNGGEP